MCKNVDGCLVAKLLQQTISVNNFSLTQKPVMNTTTLYKIWWGTEANAADFNKPALIQPELPMHIVDVLQVLCTASTDNKQFIVRVIYSVT